MQVHSTDDYLNQLHPKFSDQLKSIVYETRRLYKEVVETFSYHHDQAFPTLLNQESDTRVGLEEDNGVVNIYFNKSEVLSYLSGKYPHLLMTKGCITVDQLDHSFSSIINEGIQYCFARKK